MTPLHRSVAVAAALAIGSASAWAAKDLYSQAPSTQFADTSAIYNMPSDPGFTWSLDMDTQAWAYFRPATGGSFDRITWYGSDADGAFAVDLFAASCFSCGVNLVRSSGRFTSNLLPTAGPFGPDAVLKTALGDNLYAYTIDLPSALVLQAGSAYTLSVVNNYSALPFRWAASATGVGSHLRYIVGQAMVVAPPGNVAFTLTDSTAPVPEPASAATLGLGIAALLLMRRRQRRVPAIAAD